MKLRLGNNGPDTMLREKVLLDQLESHNDAMFSYFELHFYNED